MRKNLEGAFMKEIEEVFNNEFLKCCTNIAIKIRKLEKYILGEKERLGICGSLEKSVYKYIEDSFNEFVNEMLLILEKIQKEFNKPLPKRVITKIENQYIGIINTHFKDIYLCIENNITIQETTRSRLHNLNQNLINQAFKDFKEKNDSIKRIKKLNNENSIKNIIYSQMISKIIAIFLGFFTIANIKIVINFLKNLIEKILDLIK